MWAIDPLWSLPYCIANNHFKLNKLIFKISVKSRFDGHAYFQALQNLTKRPIGKNCAKLTGMDIGEFTNTFMSTFLVAITIVGGGESCNISGGLDLT